jgi:hypothetical protein
LRLQNDSKTTDALTLVAAQTAATGFSVTYLDGTTDVTSAIIGGTYITPDLPAGAYETIQIVFSAAPGTAYLSTAKSFLTVASASAPGVHDVLRAGVVRR